MHFILGQCQIAFGQHHTILLTLFLAGLVGGFTHCMGMCGPFIIAQTQRQMDAKLQKLSNTTLLTYHLGRMSTYMLLGSTAALLSRQIIGTPLQRWISALFLTFAGIIFIVSALPAAKRHMRAIHHKGFAYIGQWLGKAAQPLLIRPNNLQRYGLGILLGFMPCGLIFAALMSVSTTGSPITAALAMTLFTIGTLPSLLMVGIGSQLAYSHWPNILPAVARTVMLCNGISLCALAGNMIL